jgi:hypothetical protein
VSRVLSLRVPDDLAEWAESYAEQRGVTRQALLEEGLRSFRDDCVRGVPEIRAAAQRQAAAAHTTPERGVGDCPERGDGLGHVWAGVKPENGGGPENPCRFCGTSGRAFFRAATQDRVELFSHLRAPASVRGGKVKK